MTAAETIKRALDNTDWLQGLPLLEHSIRTGKITKTGLVFFQQAIPILQKVYPNEWDIQFINLRTSDYVSIFSSDPVTVHSGAFPITIHFPNTTVSNSHSKSLPIPDMYIRFTVTIQDSSIHIGDIRGCRMTFTKKEVMTHYSFSHLHSVDFNAPPQFSGFCLGSGEIRQTIALFNSDGEMPFFELFLYQLEAYLAWESLEGTPYMQLETVLNYKYRTRTVSVTNDYLTKFYTLVQMYVGEIGYDRLSTQYYDNRYHLEDNEEYLDFLMNVYIHYRSDLMQYNADITQNCLCYFVQGIYVQSGYSNSNVIPPVQVSTAPIMFQNREVRYLVTDNNETQETQEETDPQKKYLPKIIQDYVKSKLENSINKKAITTYLYKRIRDSRHPLKRSRSTDTTLVYGY